MLALTRRLLLISITHTIFLTPFVRTEAAQEEIKKAAPPQTATPQQKKTLVQFTPPPGWSSADPKALPPTVKSMVVGKGKGNFPPSINLGMEPYNGTIKQYLKIIKAINDSQGSQWKELGTIRTAAGDASLSQVDTLTEWGEVRMMHVILQKEGNIYILTAAAKKDEFPSYYKTFFDSLRSLRFTESPVDIVSNGAQKEALVSRVNILKNSFDQESKKIKNENNNLNQKEINELTFKSETFQKNHWLPFTQSLDRDFGQMGTAWKSLVTENTQTELLSEKKI